MLGLSILGLGTLQKRHSYQACIIPVLTYGLPLWFAHDGVGVKKFLLRINKVHSHACKWIVGCFRTTPIGAREVIASLPPLVLLLNSLLHGFRARIITLPTSHMLRTAMEQRWTNLAYAAVLRKTRPAHLPSDVPFRRLQTHLVQEQFEHTSDAQQPGQRVQDLYQSQITIDTSSPKKSAKTFKAWVDNLQKDLQELQRVPDSILIFEMEHIITQTTEPLTHILTPPKTTPPGMRHLAGAPRHHPLTPKSAPSKTPSNTPSRAHAMPRLPWS